MVTQRPVLVDPKLIQKWSKGQEPKFPKGESYKFELLCKEIVKNCNRK